MKVGPVYTGLMSVWLSCRIKALAHCPIGFRYKQKLFHQFTFLSTPMGTINPSCYNLSNSFLKGSCAICPGGAW